jgi:hypothetical protein
MVRFEMYNCGSKRQIRWRKIGKLGLPSLLNIKRVPFLSKMLGQIDSALVVKPYKYLSSSEQRVETA